MDGAQTGAHWTIEGVLGMMDKSAQDFHTLSADIEHIKYTAVVKDTSTETGHIYVRRDEKMRIEIAKPDLRTILRTGDSLFLFNPKINRVEEFDLGKNRAMVDQYVLLGFGTKSDNIKKSYLVSVVGEEELDHKKTVLLELTPKSDQIRNQIIKIQMWIDEASWLPVQQKFFEEFLLNRQPGSFVDPHLDLDDLVANLIGLGRQFKKDRFLVVEFLFAHYGHQVALLNVVALRSKPE